MNILEFYKDPDEIQALIKPAEEGNIEAQHDLAQAYIYAFYVEEINYKKAFYWFERAANLNHLESQCDLAFLYESGLGTKQDYTKAYQWYRKAAKQGYPRGLFRLALLYADGNGVPQDYDKAYLLCKMYVEKANHKDTFYLKKFYKMSSFSKKTNKKKEK